jgi:hypothetical protein
MKAKLIMIGSAIALAIAGLALTFIPQETAQALNIPKHQVTIVALQLLGGLYLGFAILNYMTRNTIIGGIYGRPLVLANLVHFVTGYFALNDLATPSTIKVITLCYVLFAFAFAYLMATHPSKAKKVAHK